MLLRSTNFQSTTLINVAEHLLQSMPSKTQEAVDIVSMVREGLPSSLPLNNTNLLNIAEYLLKSTPPKIQEAVELVRMIQTEKISWQSRLRVAKILFSHEQFDEAQTLLSGIDRALSKIKLMPQQLSRCALHLAACGKVDSAIKLLNSLSENENVTFLTAVTEVILQLLCQEYLENSKKLAAKIGLAKYITTDISAFLKIRLMFFDYIILGGSRHQKQLEDIIQDCNCPTVCSALSPYPSFLQRKAELILERPEECKAIKWILSAVLKEYINIPEKSDIFSTVRWLVLNRYVIDAIDIMEQYYNANPGYTDGYTYLSLYILTIGDIQRAKSCLSREIFNSCKKPYVLFARAVALGVLGEKKGAIKYLKEIYSIDSNFFINNETPTIWGMFSILLKALGQNMLSVKTYKLAENKDFYHKYRSNLLDQIPSGQRKLPIPPFALPCDFYL
jgi:tetratricopeptide (TPR) repeat protein